MRGAIPPLPNTSSLCTSYLSAGTILSFITFVFYIFYSRRCFEQFRRGLPQDQGKSISMTHCYHWAKNTRQCRHNPTYVVIKLFGIQNPYTWPLRHSCCSIVISQPNCILLVDPIMGQRTRPVITSGTDLGW